MESDDFEPNVTKESIENLNNEILKVLEFQRSGLSDQRIDLSKLKGAERTVADTCNNLIDLFINEFKETSDSIDTLLSGNETRESKKLPGNRAFLSEKIDTVKNNHLMMESDVRKILASSQKGDLGFSMDSSRYQGLFRNIITDLNSAFEMISEPFGLVSEGIDNFAEGKIPDLVDEKFTGTLGKLVKNLNRIVTVSKMRGDDIRFLISSAIDGRLDARADATKYPGYHGQIIEGINKMLDAYISPINISAEYIDRISKGDLPPRITEIYRGDFNEIKNNLNALIDVVHMRNEDIKMLINAGIDGRLDLRADAGKYPGDNGRMIEGINKMLDAYIGPINVSAEYIDRISKGDLPPKISEPYRGDFNEIKNNLNNLIDVLHMRNEDIKILITGASDGHLDIRADATKYNGENGRMIEGINKMLDAFIGPINVSAEYIDRISKGDVPAKITEDYHGDFNEIKNNLNALIDVIHLRNDDIKALITGASNGRLDLRADASKYSGENGKMIDGINKMLDAYIGPINVSAEYIDRISKGDVPAKITENYRGDFNEIKNNLNTLIDVIHLRNDDINFLTLAAQDGKLDFRADITKYSGYHGGLIDKINKMLDAYIGPINVSAEYIDRISKGDVPAKITEDYHGDFNEIKNNLNALIDAIHLRNADIDMLIEAGVNGHLDVRADSKKYSGENGKMIDGINTMLDAYIGPINVSAEYIDRISKGDVPAKITEDYHGDFNEIKNNLNALIDAIHLRNADIDMLIEAGVNGHLDVRADSKKYSGENGKMIDGINTMLDAYIGPINVSAEYIDRISKGDVPAKITEDYHGDFNEIKNNLNALIDAIHLRNADIDMLIEAGVNGHLDVRADSKKYSGENGKMIDGINTMLDAYIGPINVSAEYIDRISKGDVPAKITEDYHGDFNEIKNNLNALIDAVHLRNADIDMLIEAGVNGHLDVRADSKKYSGENGKMIDGINTMLDAYIGPINVSAEYIDRISKGDVPAKITEDYHGDFNEIKNNLNALIDAIHLRNADIDMLIEAGVNGHLDVRADSKKYSGENGKMIDGINTMLDAYIGPLNLAAEYIDRISKGDLPAMITDEYRGDFNEIKNNLNMCISTLSFFVDEMRKMYEAQKLGDIDVVIPDEKFIGVYQRMAKGVNDGVQLHVHNILKILSIIVSYAEGDFSPVLEKLPGKQAIANEKMDLLRSNLRELISGVDNLMLAAVEGKLDTRADSSLLHGDFSKILIGFNEILDTVMYPVQEAMRVATEYSRCNFSDEFSSEVPAKGEFKEFKGALNTIGEEVSKTIRILNDEIVSLRKHADTAHYGVEDVSRGAKEIAHNAVESSANAEKSEEGIDQVIRAMADLTIMVGEISSNADVVARLSENANTLAKNGIQSAGNAESGMDSITRSSSEVEHIINEIRDEMNQIRKIVNIITDLANQTNLLALNAAIEAARAGEAGRGFAVVASEVKSLAQESRTSAESIADMILGLEKKSESAAVAIDASGKAVNDGSKAVSDTLVVFKELTTSVETINEKMLTIARATEQQAASFEEITASANEMSTLVKRTADDATQSSATSEEALAVVSQITDIIELINQAVDNMTNEMKIFRLRDIN